MECPKGPREDPWVPRDVCKGHRKGPRVLMEGPKDPFEYRKGFMDEPKVIPIVIGMNFDGPGVFLEGPKGPMEVPQGPIERHKGPREGPKEPREGPTGSQEGPKGWSNLVGASGVRNESRRIVGDFRELLPYLVLPPPSPTLPPPPLLEGASGVSGVWRRKETGKGEWHWCRGKRVGEAANPGPPKAEATVGEAKNPGPTCGELKKRSSKHRPRGKKPKQVDLVLFNTSGEKQLCDALDHYRSTRSAPGQVQVAALVTQEHHLRGDSWVDMQH